MSGISAKSQNRGRVELLQRWVVWGDAGRAGQGRAGLVAGQSKSRAGRTGQGRAGQGRAGLVAGQGSTRQGRTRIGRDGPPRR